MAQKVTVAYYSDLSDKAITDNDAPTVSFALDGTNYEIDLTDAEQETMRKALAKYIEAGKKVTGSRGGRKPTKSASGNAAEIRAWAKSNGHKVPDRGRIPAEVREAFEAAN